MRACSMLYKNRSDAGKQLAQALKNYLHASHTTVIGLPRGGVVLAYEIAQALELDLDILCPRKIGAPSNPEFAIGAITESGEGFFDVHLIKSLGVTEEYLQKKIQEEIKEAKRRLQVYRGDRPAFKPENQTVLLVDDGIATGATMKAAILALRKGNVHKIILCVPVAAMDSLKEIKPLVDQVICLSAPPFFRAVGQFYLDFEPTTDQEVYDLLHQKKH